MLLDGLGWSHYSVFAPCIMTQTRVLGRSGRGCASCSYFKHRKFSYSNSTSCYSRRNRQNSRPLRGLCSGAASGAASEKGTI